MGVKKGKEGESSRVGGEGGEKALERGSVVLGQKGGLKASGSGRKGVTREFFFFGRLIAKTMFWRQAERGCLPRRD